jgi:hypothetical protein
VKKKVAMGGCGSSEQWPTWLAVQLQSMLTQWHTREQQWPPAAALGEEERGERQSRGA